MTRLRFWLHISFVMAMAGGLNACGGGSKTSGTSPTSPTTTAPPTSLSGVVAGVQLLGGGVGAKTAGAAPAANGGPAVVATTATSGPAGGSTTVRLNASVGFNAVFMTVSQVSPVEHFVVTLPGATSETTLVIQFPAASVAGSSIPLVFSVRTPDGQVGASSNLSSTVGPSPTSARLELTHSPNPAPCVVVGSATSPTPSTFRWPMQTTIRETNGIGVQMTGWSVNDVPVTFPFASAFVGCGGSGTKIAANGVTCQGSTAISERPTGRTYTETFTGTDDRGNSISVTGRQTHSDCPQ